MSKKYIDSRGWKYQVMSGIGEDTFKARYQRPEKQGDVGRIRRTVRSGQ